MHITSCLHKGEFHPIFCEDFLFHTELSPDLYLAAVMDGCSMGKDSQFASLLFAKILKKVSKEIGYREFAGDIPPFSSWELADLGKEFLQEIWKNLKALSQSLYLDTLELLSTLNLALLNRNHSEVWLILIGDGFIAADDQIIEVDQNNRPDYLAYHLKEDFTQWFSQQKAIYELTDIQQLILATDGVDSFEKLNPAKEEVAFEPASFFLLEPSYDNLAHPFAKKLEVLKEEHGLIATDDIGLIRIKW
ncbi:MAG: protein phosphatase 2C domain-containing protein [Bacteroidia bacterium]|nr:protein phosphatase 2C domain-containing protein [Bacteroidia bacterium]